MNWATAFFAGDEHPDHHKPLDGLRGLAVLMVVFGHGANHGLGPFGPDSMMIRGKLGVYLFFVLSAYLLDRQIIKMFQQGRAKWDYCCLLYTSPSPRDLSTSRMPSSA